MKILVQRVLKASVEVEKNCVGLIDNGLLLYVCFEKDDQEQMIEKAKQKITALRIFEDENKKMNKNIFEAKGSILSISQFTLSWDGLKGNRPSFDKSLEPALAKLMYEKFNQCLKDAGMNVQTGVFGSDMKVTSTNDGPVTFMLHF
jgi:D-tyrosyl-tRNA(Tyr) deacylase